MPDTFIELTCPNPTCKKTFSKNIKYVNYAKKQGTQIFCSRTCSTKYNNDIRHKKGIEDDISGLVRTIPLKNNETGQVIGYKIVNREIPPSSSFFFSDDDIESDINDLLK